jgi:hypothetical protein
MMIGISVGLRSVRGADAGIFERKKSEGTMRKTQKHASQAKRNKHEWSISREQIVKEVKVWHQLW